MRSKLFISLSTIALVGMSVVTRAAMVKYMENDGKVPQGDCLEMVCPYGCVEEAGTFVGHCCPNDGAYNAACTYNECCQSGVCNNNKCGPVPCQFGGKTYQHNETVGECGKCNNGTVEIGSLTAPDCKGTCNTATWMWNPVTNYTNKDSSGKCCINGVRAYDATNCPDPSTSGQCTYNGTTYSNGAAVGNCGVCDNGTIEVKSTITNPDCCNTTTWNLDTSLCPETGPEGGDLPGEGEPCEPTVGCDGKLKCGGCVHVCYRPVTCSPKRKEGGAQKKATASRSDVKAASSAECMSEVAYVKKICAESGSADKWNAWVKDSSCKKGYFGYKNANAHTEIEWIDGVKCRCGDKHSFDDKYRWLMI